MLKDLVKANRSCRGFDRSRKVSREELLEIIDTARLASSAINMQPLKYFISNEDIITDKITKMVSFGGLLKDLNLPFEGEEPPAYIVICHDTSIVKEEPIFINDVGIAAEIIGLAATEMGLSVCLMAGFDSSKIKKELFLPDNMEVKLVIAIGKSLEKVKIKEVGSEESVKYYRDENGVHVVPKRKLEDIIIN